MPWHWEKPWFTIFVECDNCETEVEVTYEDDTTDGGLLWSLVENDFPKTDHEPRAYCSVACKEQHDVVVACMEMKTAP